MQKAEKAEERITEREEKIQAKLEEIGKKQEEVFKHEETKKLQNSFRFISNILNKFEDKKSDLYHNRHLVKIINLQGIEIPCKCFLYLLIQIE